MVPGVRMASSKGKMASAVADEFQDLATMVQCGAGRTVEIGVQERDIVLAVEVLGQFQRSRQVGLHQRTVNLLNAATGALAGQDSMAGDAP